MSLKLGTEGRKFASKSQHHTLVQQHKYHQTSVVVSLQQQQQSRAVAVGRKVAVVLRLCPPRDLDCVLRSTTTQFPSKKDYVPLCLRALKISPCNNFLLLV